MSIKQDYVLRDAEHQIQIKPVRTERVQGDTEKYRGGAMSLKALEL